MFFVQVTFLWLMVTSWYEPNGASILDKNRVKLKRELNEDVRSKWILKRQNGSMLVDLLNPGTIHKAMLEKQNLAEVQLSNIENVSHSNAARQHGIAYSVNEKNEKQLNAIKRSAYVETNSETHDCQLKVADESVLKFNNRILYDKASAFTLNLTFPTFTSIKWKPGTILPFKWVWVYRQTLTFLNMPRSASIWSLGLLDMYYHIGPLSIEIEPNNTRACEGIELEIGEPETDHKIGQALGEMMHGLAMKHLRFNTSHWCYMNTRYGSDNEITRALDNNFFSISPTLQFVCCSYDLTFDTKLNVKCQDIHGYDTVWWDVPLGLGILMWLYFPLLFIKLSGRIHKEIKKSSVANEEADRISVNVQVTGPVTTPDNATNTNDINIVFNDGKSPITVFSMIKASVSKLVPRKQKNKSRMAIFIYSILTLIIPGIEVLVHYIYLFDYIQSLAEYNISFGFSSVMTGWDKARDSKLSIFGGPIIAICIYLVVGWILMLSPKIMANQIYRGVCDSSEKTKSILGISLAKKEKLGSTGIRQHRNGYIRLSKLQVCHLYMLINPDYWILTGTLLKERYGWFASALKSRLPVTCFRFPILCFCFPFYAVFCLIEVIVGLLYYCFPMFSFLFCITVGFSLGINKYISVKIVPRFSRLGLILRYPICLIVFLMLIYYLYIFTVLFIDSFFFVSRILLFTYTAVVAYPRETYGYFMLILLSAYFGFKGFFRFGNIYKLMLKLTIKLCKQDEVLRDFVVRNQTLDGNETYGIPKEMFEFLVEHIRPRRVRIFHTAIRCVIMVFILSISIVLMERFEKFDDISLLVHVFITLFICAIPYIYKSMISKENTKQKLTRKLKKHLRGWILRQRKPSNDFNQNIS